MCMVQSRFVDVCDPVGVADIAQRLGVKQQTAAVWKKRRLLPEPRWTVSGQPAWNWPDIFDWADRTGRLPEALIISRLSTLCDSSLPTGELARLALMSRSIQEATIRPGGILERVAVAGAGRTDLTDLERRVWEVCVELSRPQLGTLRDDSVDASGGFLNALTLSGTLDQ